MPRHHRIPRIAMIGASLALLGTASIPGAMAVRDSGTSGPDRLVGGSGADVLSGLSGSDTLIGGPGNDRIFGGDDGDLMIGSRGSDALHGNAGGDRGRGGPGADTLAGGSGHDKLAGGPGPDSILGGDHGDRLGGGPGADVIRGGGGPDVIVGGPGRDSVRGGAGRDQLRLIDGELDRAACGTGTDRVLADMRDIVAASCERVVRHGAGFRAGGPVSAAASAERPMRMGATGAEPNASMIAWGHEQDVLTRVCVRISGPAGAPVEVTFTDAGGGASGASSLGPDGSLTAQVEIEAPETALDPTDATANDETVPFTGPVAVEVTIGRGAQQTTLIDRYEVSGQRAGIPCDDPLI